MGTGLFCIPFWRIGGVWVNGGVFGGKCSQFGVDKVLVAMTPVFLARAFTCRWTR